MDSDEDSEKELKPTFRIRFTISNSNQSATSESSTTKIYCKNNQNQHSCQEHVTHKCNHQTNLNDVDGSSQQTSSKAPPKKSFKFIRPQNHKSSLFVNLTDTSSSGSVGQQSGENCLFISPDLNQSLPATPPSPGDSTLSSSITLAETNLSKMSQGCSFINTMFLARRRSASATPSSNATIESTGTTNDSNNGRRASSSNNLAAPQAPVINKSCSGNHLAVGISNETICDGDQTQVNKHSINSNGDYVQHSDIDTIMQPLQVVIDDIDRSNSDVESRYYPVTSSGQHDHFINLDKILQTDPDETRLANECKNLENQIEFWEKHVEDLERERFSEASRTLVDKVLRQRKKLRNLDFQIYKLTLKTEDQSSNYLSHSKGRELYSPQDDVRQAVDFAVAGAGRFGSHIRPGQENTADILDAIPPSGSLQHQQYLSKASTGTDTSEYSQLPSFNQHHKHQLPSSNQSYLIPSNVRDSRHQHHHHPKNPSHYHQGRRQSDDVYVQLDEVAEPRVMSGCSKNNRLKSSPVRPDHFKGDFKTGHQAVVSQGSSSTASSSSPIN